jgi:uncharacterized protein (TIGR02118 family)
MIRMFVMYGAPTDADAFNKYYNDVHIPLVRKMPHMVSCEVSTGPAAIGPEGGEYHLVAILNFNSKADMDASMSSPEGQAVVADVPNYATGGVTLVTAEYAEV